MADCGNYKMTVKQCLCCGASLQIGGIIFFSSCAETYYDSFFY